MSLADTGLHEFVCLPYVIVDRDLRIFAPGVLSRNSYFPAALSVASCVSSCGSMTSVSLTLPLPDSDDGHLVRITRRGKHPGK